MRSHNPQAELDQLQSELQRLVVDLKAAYRLITAKTLTYGALVRVATTLRQSIDKVQTMLAPQWPEQTTDEPDLETLEAWMEADGGCEATDGCWVEPDGVCTHGHPSWLVKLGLI